MATTSDVHLTQAIQAALALEPEVPRDAVRVDVADGFVTLSGTVDWDYQRLAAEHAASEVPGVKSVTNTIVVAQPQTIAGDVRSQTTEAFARHGALSDAELEVIVEEGGRVRLTGIVRTLAERDLAEAAARRVRGVTEVRNDIAVIARKREEGQHP